MLVILVGKLVAWRLKLEVGSKALKLEAWRLELEACRLKFPPSDGSLASLGCIPLYGEGSSDYVCGPNQVHAVIAPSSFLS